MRRLLTRAFSVPGGYSRHQDQAAAGTGSLSSFLTHIFSISKPKNMAVCVLCQNTKCSFKFPNIHRMELLVYPFSKDTCLVADACAPARPCRSIRHGQCRALGVQDVGGHLLRAPMRSGPCGLSLPHPLVPGLAGMDGRAETRRAPDATGLSPSRARKRCEH